MSAEPQQVVVTRTRHENGSSSGLGSAKTREWIFSLGAIGLGALGGYYALDYIIKTQAIEKMLERFGISFNGNGTTDTIAAGEPNPSTPKDTDKIEADISQVANFAHIVEDARRPSEIFDRTTRVNSYAARQFNRRPSPIVEGGIDITQFQTGVPQNNEINQIVTDDEVYDSF